MVVRHPFERLLSAYRDKLEDLSRDIEARDGYYFTMYGKQVQYSTVQYSTVQYYFTMYGKQIVAEFRDRGSTNGTEALEPSWREFVTYLLNTPATKYDEHWMPMWMLCSPCIIRYVMANTYQISTILNILDMMRYPRWRPSQKTHNIFYNRQVWRISFL